MENPKKDTVSLQSAGQLSGVELDASVVGSGEEQRDESEPESGPKIQPDVTPEVPADVQPGPKSEPSSLALIKFRMKQLHNRRYVLEKIHDFTKKAQEKRLAEGGTEELTSEDDPTHELEAIDKELKELQLKKAALELKKPGKRSRPGGNGGHQGDLEWYESEAPSGGIYTLPFANIGGPPEPRIPPQALIPVEDLVDTPGFTKCPTCEQHVVTETRSKVGELTWLLCCMCSVLGGFAGCCLMPFYLDSMKDFDHHCPRCQSHIHTFQRW